ncbi:MAG TPA: nucleotidyltransferase family protein, partial [Alphaproteobacteria bacterium]|nr:nucleotidyltransferase family protein [Alphaproteobacteria bacterium]
MTPISGTAMVLAAGRGVRMQPLSLTTPKPLLKVGGKPMLDHVLDKLVAQGIRRAVVNTFYLPEQIEEHCKTRKDIEIIISRETELLDTGGGVKNVLRHFGGEPFFVLNADLPWTEGKVASLRRMATMWNAPKMNALLLVMPREKARGFGPDGDFNLLSGGILKRESIAPPRSHVLISA